MHPTSKALLGKPKRLPGVEALPFPSSERVNEGGGKARPGVQHCRLPAGSLVSQPVWQLTEEDAEEAFNVNEESLEDHEEGFQGFNDQSWRVPPGTYLSHSDAIVHVYCILQYCVPQA